MLTFTIQKKSPSHILWDVDVEGGAEMDLVIRPFLVYARKNPCP